jgi:STE24 endopeptidase
MSPLLALFVALRLGQQALESALAAVNRRFTLEPGRLERAFATLGIDPGEISKAVAYSADRYRLSQVYGWSEVAATLIFLVAGGLGAVEGLARRLAAALGLGPIVTGLAFFAALGLLGSVFELPFDLFATFRVEQRHGFNRQTLGGFARDRLKGLLLAVALGGPVLAAILRVMQTMGSSWWIWAWGVTTAFSLLTAWIYPTLLAPLFNRFTPLAAGELRDAILELARRIGFRTGGIFVMDASRRSAHGNAYFTGLFGQKRIVLFDTLVEALSAREVVAVLAHELGHFKLHHVRWAVLRSVASSGVVFYALAVCLPLAAFYRAFFVSVSAWGALVVFGLWFSLLGFVLKPIGSAISRRSEFAADAFALRSGASAQELGAALLKLRERSRLLPISHPLYSRVYHSHPPLVERLRAMGSAAPADEHPA